MKFTFFADDKREEVIVYSKEETQIVNRIREIAEGCTLNLIGYIENEKVILDIDSVYCFIVENSKVYALTHDKRYKLRSRLYQIEETLPDYFLKLNQSCVANINFIDRFSATISTSLIVRFKNGYEEYISRRQLKTVKERMGL